MISHSVAWEPAISESTPAGFAVVSRTSVMGIISMIWERRRVSDLGLEEQTLKHRTDLEKLCRVFIELSLDHLLSPIGLCTCALHDQIGQMLQIPSDVTISFHVIICESLKLKESSDNPPKDLSRARSLRS